MFNKFSSEGVLDGLNPGQQDALRYLVRMLGAGLLGGAGMRLGVGALRQTAPSYEPPPPPKPLFVDVPYVPAESVPPGVGPKTLKRASDPLGTFMPSAGRAGAGEFKGLSGAWDDPSHNPYRHWVEVEGEDPQRLLIDARTDQPNWVRWMAGSDIGLIRQNSGLNDPNGPFSPTGNFRNFLDPANLDAIGRNGRLDRLMPGTTLETREITSQPTASLTVSAWKPGGPLGVQPTPGGGRPRVVDTGPSMPVAEPKPAPTGPMAEAKPMSAPRVPFPKVTPPPAAVPVGDILKGLPGPAPAPVSPPAPMTPKPPAPSGAAKAPGVPGPLQPPAVMKAANDPAVSKPAPVGLDPAVSKAAPIDPYGFGTARVPGQPLVPQVDVADDAAATKTVHDFNVARTTIAGPGPHVPQDLLPGDYLLRPRHVPGPTTKVPPGGPLFGEPNPAWGGTIPSYRRVPLAQSKPGLGPVDRGGDVGPPKIVPGLNAPTNAVVPPKPPPGPGGVGKPMTPPPPPPPKPQDANGALGSWGWKPGQKQSNDNVFPDWTGEVGKWVTRNVVPTYNPPAGKPDAQTWKDVPLSALGLIPAVVGGGMGGYLLTDKIMRAAQRRGAKGDLEKAKEDYQKAVLGRTYEAYRGKEAMVRALLGEEQTTDPELLMAKEAVDRAFEAYEAREGAEKAANENPDMAQRFVAFLGIPGLAMGPEMARLNMALMGGAATLGAAGGYMAMRDREAAQKLRKEVERLERQSMQGVTPPLVGRLVPVRPSGEPTGAAPRALGAV